MSEATSTTMTEATSTTSKTPLPIFDGSYSEYDTWRFKFFARAQSKTGWIDILRGTKKLPAGSDVDFTTMVEKVKIKKEPGVEGTTETVKALTPEETTTLQQA